MLMLKNFTHRQQHALELLGGADAPEEGQQTDQGGGRNQHVDRPGEQVRPEQLVDEVLVDQRPHAEPEHDGTAELKVKKKNSKNCMPSRRGSHMSRDNTTSRLLTKMMKLETNMLYLTHCPQQSILPPEPIVRRDLGASLPVQWGCPGRVKRREVGISLVVFNKIRLGRSKYFLNIIIEIIRLQHFDGKKTIGNALYTHTVYMK